MKRQKGRVTNVPKVGERRPSGEYSIVSKEPGRITGEQIKAIIMTLKRKMPAGTEIRTRVRASLSMTAKPQEVRMGKGKGAIAKRIARVRANKVIVEVACSQAGARDAGKILIGLRAAASKMPVRVHIYTS